MILITGATGFVGSYLALHLAEKGQNISAIYPKKSGIQKTKDLFDLFDKGHLFHKITWIKADLTDIPALEIAFENIEYIYHCAGKSSFDRRDEKLLRKMNIEGTANVVNIGLAKKVKKICFLSSVETLGDLSNTNSSDSHHPISTVITESSEWNPEKVNSDFAISKYGAEMEIWRGQQEGLEVVIVNPGFILGAVPKSWNSHKGSFELMTKFVYGHHFYTSGATGFVGVKDVVSFMVQLMESSLNGNRYILVSENLSFKQIATVIATASKVTPPQQELQKWKMNLALFWNWIKATLFFQKRTLFHANAQWLYAKNVYSNEKIKSALQCNFQPMTSVIEEMAEKY